MKPWAAVLLAAACAVVAGCGDSKEDGSPPLRGEAALEHRFADIPQHGAILGRPDAPFTLVEFADLQCPFCARFDREILPRVLRDFVRPGQLRLELRPVAFLGPDSSVGAAAAVAAGFQDRMWQFADLVYRNQGPENSGYMTPEFLGRAAKGAEIGVDEWNSESNSKRLVGILKANARAARTAGITGTPGFRVGPTGGILTPFAEGPTAPVQFGPRLRRKLAQLQAEG